VRRIAGLIWASSLLIGVSAASAGVPETNAQVWGEVDVALPVTSTVSATVLGVVRDGDGLPNPALAGGGLTLEARAGSWGFTAGDLWVAVRGSASRKALDVDVPLIAVTYSWSFAGVAFDERNRIERLYGVSGDPWRYRNPLQVAHPLKRLGPIGSVFASDEIFYDFARRSWSRNRAQVGFGLPIDRREQIQVYYLRQDDRYARPGALNALGLTYKVDLR
jgi:hypothetical protein